MNHSNGEQAMEADPNDDGSGAGNRNGRWLFSIGQLFEWISLALGMHDHGEEDRSHPPTAATSTTTNQACGDYRTEQARAGANAGANGGTEATSHHVARGNQDSVGGKREDNSGENGGEGEEGGSPDGEGTTIANLSLVVTAKNSTTEKIEDSSPSPDNKSPPAVVPKRAHPGDKSEDTKVTGPAPNKRAKPNNGNKGNQHPTKEDGVGDQLASSVKALTVHSMGSNCTKKYPICLHGHTQGCNVGRIDRTKTATATLASFARDPSAPSLLVAFLDAKHDDYEATAKSFMEAIQSKGGKHVTVAVSFDGDNGTTLKKKFNRIWSAMKKSIVGVKRLKSIRWKYVDRLPPEIQNVCDQNKAATFVKVDMSAGGGATHSHTIDTYLRW